MERWRELINKPLKTFWIFGYKKWDYILQHRIWTNGKCYRPLWFGIWIRDISNDKFAARQQTTRK